MRCSLDWDRRRRVTPAGLFSWRVIFSENRFPLFRITRKTSSQEAWLEPRLGRRKSPRREPRWDAERRAPSVCSRKAREHSEGAPRPAGRGSLYASLGVPLPFLFVIAGLVPAIHAEGRPTEKYRYTLKAGLQHGPPGQARWRRGREWLRICSMPDGRAPSPLPPAAVGRDAILIRRLA